MEKPGERQKRSLKIEKHKTHDKAGAGTWIKRNLALFMAIVTLLGALGLDVRVAYGNPNTIDVYFDFNGGTYSDGSTIGSTRFQIGYRISTNVDIGNINPPNPNAAFAGWHTVRTGQIRSTENDSTEWLDSTILTPAHAPSLTLYAKWEQSVNITLNLHGGTLVPNPSPIRAVVGRPISPFPANPVRNGHSFDGWFTAAGVRILPNTNLPANVTTLHAIWSQNPRYVDVILNANGGGWANGNPGPLRRPIGQQAVPNATARPTRDGYEFTNQWRIAPTSGTAFNQTISGTRLNDNNAPGSSITLYAQWIPAAQEITFNRFDSARGWSPNPQTTTVAYNTTTGVSPDRPVPSNVNGIWNGIIGGARFSNWYADPYFQNRLTNIRWSSINPIEIDVFARYVREVQFMVGQENQNMGTSRVFFADLTAPGIFLPPDEPNDIFENIPAELSSDSESGPNNLSPTSRVASRFAGWYMDRDFQIPFTYQANDGIIEGLSFNIDGIAQVFARYERAYTETRRVRLVFNNRPVPKNQTNPISML